MRFWNIAFISVILLATATGSRPIQAPEDIAALIKRQSQEFSDASATGDIVVLGRYLDDRVVFMDESGVLSSKKEILASTRPPQKGVSNSLVQTDWLLELRDSVAVTSFTDVSTLRFHGQTLQSKYRSTEVWLKEDAGWKMVSSQTIALLDDPPSVTLPTQTLDEYVGTYYAGGEYIFQISRSGSELRGTVNKGKPFMIMAEVRDVLFTPGQPRLRRIIQRDATGKVIGFLSRREGHDILVKRRL